MMTGFEEGKDEGWMDGKKGGWKGLGMENGKNGKKISCDYTQS
jgi:hypothetical protein